VHAAIENGWIDGGVDDGGDGGVDDGDDGVADCVGNGVGGAPRQKIILISPKAFSLCFGIFCVRMHPLQPRMTRRGPELSSTDGMYGL
jgi:hypothetical protein